MAVVFRKSAIYLSLKLYVNKARFWLWLPWYSFAIFRQMT